MIISFYRIGLNKIYAALLLFLVFLIPQFAFADETGIEAAKKINRKNIEEQREKLQEEERKELDADLYHKILPPKTIDLCEALDPLIEYSKKRLIDSPDEYEKTLNALFLAKASKVKPKDTIPSLLKYLEKEYSDVTSEESAICLNENIIDSGIPLEYLEKAKEVLKRTSTKNANNRYGLFNLQFRLLLFNELGIDEEGAEEALRGISLQAPNNGSGDSLLTTYLYATSMLAVSSVSKSEKEILAASVNTNNPLSVAYALTGEYESPRASSGRAVPVHLALYRHEDDPQKKKIQRKNLIDSLIYFTSPEVLPYLVVHHYSPANYVHIGQDRLGYHYLHPALPYVSSALKLLLNEKSETAEEHEQLQTIQNKLINLIANLKETDGLFDGGEQLYNVQNPFIGLSILPLIDKCEEEEVNVNGILSSDPDSDLPPRDISEFINNFQINENNFILGESRLDFNEFTNNNSDPELELLVRKLRSSNKDTSIAAIERLRKIGISALPILMTALQAKNWEVRMMAAIAIGEIGPEAKDAVPALIVALNDQGTWEVRMQAAEALGNIGQEAKDAVPALITALNDIDRDVRKEAAITLGRIGPDAREAIPALMVALNDQSSWEVRMQAAEALGKIGPDAREAIPALIKSLGDPDGYINRYSVKALAKIGPTSEDIPVLLTALNDNHWRVRIYAAKVLGNIGAATKGTVPSLVKALDDKNEEVLINAATALEKIDPTPEDVPELITALNYNHWRVRMHAAIELGKLGTGAKDAIPRLVKALGDKDDDVQTSAALAIEAIGSTSEDLLPALINLLDDGRSSDGGKLYAAMTLEKMGPGAENAVPALIKALHHKNKNVRLYAAKALGKIGRAAKDALLELQERAKNDSSAMVRYNAELAKKLIENDTLVE